MIGVELTSMNKILCRYSDDLLRIQGFDWMGLGLVNEYGSVSVFAVYHFDRLFCEIGGKLPSAGGRGSFRSDPKSSSIDMDSLVKQLCAL